MRETKRGGGGRGRPEREMDVREMEMWVEEKALRVRVANARHSRMSDVRRHLPGILGQTLRR